MTLLNNLFGNKIVYTDYYSKINSLKSIRKDFEHYIFLVYEKVEIITEIRNKYYEIINAEKGYIKEEEKAYRKEKNKNFYFKRWVNKRLKRVKKILTLEASSKFGILSQEKNVAQLIESLKSHFEIQMEEQVTLKGVLTDLTSLEQNLRKQIIFIEDIYPISDWNLETHENLFSNDFMKLIKEEVELIFKKPFDNNYNNYLAVISKGIHEANLPLESTLDGLIRNKIEILKKLKKENFDKSIEICYHARPIFSTNSLFPLDTKNK